MTHICAGNLTITGSDNGLSPGRRQAMIWTNAGILSIGPLGTNFCFHSDMKFQSEFKHFSFKKMHFKVSSAKWRPFYLGLNGFNVSSVDYDRCRNDVNIPWCHPTTVPPLFTSSSSSSSSSLFAGQCITTQPNCLVGHTYFSIIL